MNSDIHWIPDNETHGPQYRHQSFPGMSPSTAGQYPLSPHTAYQNSFYENERHNPGRQSSDGVLMTGTIQHLSSPTFHEMAETTGASMNAEGYPGHSNAETQMSLHLSQEPSYYGHHAAFSPHMQQLSPGGHWYGPQLSPQGLQQQYLSSQRHPGSWAMRKIQTSSYALSIGGYFFEDRRSAAGMSWARTGKQSLKPLQVKKQQIQHQVSRCEHHLRSCSDYSKYLHRSLEGKPSEIQAELYNVNMQGNEQFEPVNFYLSLFAFTEAEGGFNHIIQLPRSYHCCCCKHRMDHKQWDCGNTYQYNARSGRMVYLPPHVLQWSSDGREAIRYGARHLTYLATFENNLKGVAYITEAVFYIPHFRPEKWQWTIVPFLRSTIVKSASPLLRPDTCGRILGHYALNGRPFLPSNSATLATKRVHERGLNFESIPFLRPVLVEVYWLSRLHQVQEGEASCRAVIDLYGNLHRISAKSRTWMQIDPDRGFSPRWINVRVSRLA